MIGEIGISALITLAVLSYVVTDKIFFRLAMHILVGLGATYVLTVAIDQVLRPKLLDPLLHPSDRDLVVVALLGLLGCIFLFAKVLKRTAWLGNVAMGYMIGVGTAIALGGALIGTLGPQTLSAVAPLSSGDAGSDVFQTVLSNILILISTLVVLLAFRYRRTAARSVSGMVARLGRAFLYVAFGATFALVFIASASVLVALVQALVSPLINAPPG